VVDHDTLVRFVYESNAIEDLTSDVYGPGTPEFDRHLAAAYLVADTGTLDFLEIHRVLMGPDDGGRVRTDDDDLLVSGREAPRAGPELDSWIRLLNHVVAESVSHGVTPAEHALACHDLLVLAHPCRDGNGRTARLLYNAVAGGLTGEWTIFESGARRTYQRRIESVAASFWPDPHGQFLFDQTALARLAMSAPITDWPAAGIA
jgi:hypothetical protein